MMKKEEDNIIVDKSFRFAIRIANLYKYLVNEKREFIMSKQLMRCGTSVGANVREGIRAQSKPDFHSKMCVALKEASESEYWIDLLIATDYLSMKETESLRLQCNELVKILMSITLTSKQSLSNISKK